MAYIGDHSVAIGIFHDNRVSLDRLFPGGIVPPTYGYAYTQAAYDLITPDETLYYAIYSTASGEAIHATLELSQAEYDDISSHVADTLYIIMDGTDIEDVRLGDTQADKLYLGTTVLWTLDPTPSWIPSDWAQRMPALPSSYASYAVIAIKYGSLTCVYRIQARDVSRLDSLDCGSQTAQGAALNIFRPLHGQYAVWAKARYYNNGTFKDAVAYNNGNYTEYAGTTSLDYFNDCGGAPNINAICIEHQGDIVWNNTTYI